MLFCPSILSFFFFFFFLSYGLLIRLLLNFSLYEPIVPREIQFFLCIFSGPWFSFIADIRTVQLSLLQVSANYIPPVMLCMSHHVITAVLCQSSVVYDANTFHDGH